MTPERALLLACRNAMAKIPTGDARYLVIVLDDEIAALDAFEEPVREVVWVAEVGRVAR